MSEKELIKLTRMLPTETQQEAGAHPCRVWI